MIHSDENGMKVSDCCNAICYLIDIDFHAGSAKIECMLCGKTYEL